MTYEEWVNQYQPEKNNIVAADRGYDGTMFETYGPELDYVHKIREQAPGRVWTLIAGDDGGMYLSDGYHFVNRQGYFITAIPCGEKSIEIVVGDPDRYVINQVDGGSFQIYDQELQREICVVSDYDTDQGFSNDAEARAEMILAALHDTDATFEQEVTDGQAEVPVSTGE